jgi:nitroreductase
MSKKEVMMELTELANLMKTRRSIRRWQDKKVPEDLLLKAIELATWAPNGGNQQNWHFYLILNRTTINALADAVQDIANIASAWPEAAKMGLTARLRDKASLFRDAPALIGVSAARYQSPLDQVLEVREKVDPQAARIRQWRNISNSRIQSVAAAIAYLLLVLHQMGLGAVWMSGPTQAKAGIERILNIPPELDFIAFIPVGYPAEAPVSGGRKLVGEVCQVLR